MSELDAKFEVTQILASRCDSDGDEWLLVQWGCTWILRAGMTAGPLLEEFVHKPKLSQLSVRIPIEEGTQTAFDADAAAAESQRKKQKLESDGQHVQESDVQRDKET